MAGDARPGDWHGAVGRMAVSVPGGAIMRGVTTDESTETTGPRPPRPATERRARDAGVGPGRAFWSSVALHAAVFGGLFVFAAGAAERGPRASCSVTVPLTETDVAMVDREPPPEDLPEEIESAVVPEDPSDEPPPPLEWSEVFEPAEMPETTPLPVRNARFAPARPRPVAVKQTLRPPAPPVRTAPARTTRSSTVPRGARGPAAARPRSPAGAGRRPSPRTSPPARPPQATPVAPPQPVVPPVALARNSKPTYPRRARRRGQTGVVRLEIDVLPDGGVAAVRVVQSSGHESLDEAARAVALTWRFRPAHRGGKPIPFTVRQPVRFAL